MQHFVYLWFDKVRKMFYVGSHSGMVDDGYVSSSRWFNGEYRYRPQDFKRRVICFCGSKNEAQRTEGRLLASIAPLEFGTKYYNMKIGKPLGSIPWNKGRCGIYSEDALRKKSEAMKGNKSNTGKPQPHAAANGKRGAKKLSDIATGRKRVYRDGKRTWAYPTDADYPKEKAS